MISLGADRMSVVLDFQIGIQRYRVARVVRRSGTRTAQLELLGPDSESQPLKDGVREVNDAVARLVGLSYDAFIQAVVLPQGEFQRFLKDEPRDVEIFFQKYYDSKSMRECGASPRARAIRLRKLYKSCSVA
jgi:exonuclease SbcC